MTRDEQLAALEERLQPLRERIDTTFKELDDKALHVRSAVSVAEIVAAKARHVALDALAEIRHIDEELRKLKAESSTKSSPGSRRATARSRSRAGLD